MKKGVQDQVDKRIIYDPYIPSILNMKIYVPIAEVGKNIKIHHFPSLFHENP